MPQGFLRLRSVRLPHHQRQGEPPRVPKPIRPQRVDRRQRDLPQGGTHDTGSEGQIVEKPISIRIGDREWETHAKEIRTVFWKEQDCVDIKDGLWDVPAEYTSLIRGVFSRHLENLRGVEIAPEHPQADTAGFLYRLAGTSQYLLQEINSSGDVILERVVHEASVPIVINYSHG